MHSQIVGVLAVAFAFKVLSTSGVDTTNFCCLCEGCSSPLEHRLRLAVNTQGYTCNALAMDVADPSNTIRAGNAACAQLQNQWRNHCCNSFYVPVAIPQGPTQSPGARYPRGPHSSCQICPNGNIPVNRNTVVAVLNYPQVNTCIGLHWAALNGHFEDRLCRPLRNFFENPCGCNNGNASTNTGGNSISYGGVTSTVGTNPQTRPQTGTSTVTNVGARKDRPVEDRSKLDTKIGTSNNHRGQLKRQRARGL